MQKFIKSSLLVFLGGIFIFSALAKLMPIEFFEYQIADTGWFSWRHAQIIARVVIGVELAIGVLLILYIRLRKFTIPVALLMLLGFTILLIYQWVTYGNQANCGCFGDKLEVSTQDSIIKNVAFMAMLVLVYNMVPKWEWTLNLWVPLIVLIAGVVVPFFGAKPIPQTDILSRKKLNTPVDYSALYDSTMSESVPNVDLSKGKHIVSFVTLECKHCQLATQKMAIMKRNNPKLPFYIVMVGDTALMSNFMNITKAENLDRTYFKNEELFIKMAGGAGFPSINWINNNTLEYKTVHYELLQEDVEQWIKQP